MSEFIGSGPGFQNGYRSMKLYMTPKCGRLLVQVLVVRVFIIMMNYENVIPNGSSVRGQ